MVQNTFDKESVQIFPVQEQIIATFSTVIQMKKKNRSGAYFVFQEHNIKSKVYTFYKIIFNVSI